MSYIYHSIMLNRLTCLQLYVNFFFIPGHKTCQLLERLYTCDSSPGTEPFKNMVFPQYVSVCFLLLDFL